MRQVRKLVKAAGEIWAIAGITLLLLLCLEGSAWLAFWLNAAIRGSPAATMDRRAGADAYAGVSWATKYYEEFKRSQVVEWKPYVYWRQKAHQGDFINITANGLRHTPSPLRADPGRSAPLRIFMFGGSTLWGTGARDSMTIPAILSAELLKRGIAAEVINYAESGYVSTQELIGLLLELQNENIPDLVVFYDGVNDTFSAYQQGIAGLTQNEFHRTAELGLLAPANRAKLWRATADAAIQDLSSVRLLRRIGIIRPGSTSGAHSSLGHEDDLAQAVIDKYGNNVRMVGALARQYGFKSLFYWQPTIFQKRHLTEYESSWHQEVRPIEQFFLSTYAALGRRMGDIGRHSQIVDLSEIFADVEVPLYVDWCHLAEGGNALVAKRMAGDIALLLGSR